MSFLKKTYVFISVFHHKKQKTMGLPKKTMGFLNVTHGLSAKTHKLQAIEILNSIASKCFY